MTRLRRLLGLLALAAAAWWLSRAISELLWPTRALYGVAPWGDPYGVRVTPLSAAEREAALARERILGGLDTGEQHLSRPSQSAAGGDSEGPAMTTPDRT